MNKPFYILLFVLLSSSFKAQTNLVPNGGFEDIDSCYGTYSPTGFDVFQWSGCSGWKNPTFASSDLFCPFIGAPCNPPNIGGDFQYPFEGTNMAGFYAAYAGFWNYREYIQSTLSITLESGKCYELSFRINTSGNNNVTSSIGAYFSSYPVGSVTSWDPLPFQPQIENPDTNFIVDTMGYQIVSGVFKAQGGEKFMTIGNFRDSFNIIMTNYDTLTAAGIYLFIDDIKLIESPYSYQIPNVFSPNNDLTNDFFSLNILNFSHWTCEIFNRWGIKVAELSEKNNFWDGRTTSGIACNDGVYYYLFNGETDKQKINEKGFIQLLR